MQLGVLLAHLDPSVDPLTISAAARSADHLGYHSVWAVDPALAPDGDRAGTPIGLDAVAAIALAARSTRRVGLGLHVPVAAAEAILGDAEVTEVTAGRLSVAVDVAVEAVDVAVDGTAAPVVGLARPPCLLLVSSASPELAVRAAAQVDGWLATRSPLDAIRATWASILATVADAGRDPAAMSLFVRADIGLTERPLSRHRSIFCGSIDQVVDDLLAVDELGTTATMLAFAGQSGLDELLGGYAAIAEGLELRSAT